MDLPMPTQAELWLRSTAPPHQPWSRSGLVQGYFIEDYDVIPLAKILRCGWMDPERVMTLHGAFGFGGHAIDDESDVALLDLRFGGLRQIDFKAGIREIFHTAQAYDDRYHRDGGYMVIAALLPMPLGVRVMRANRMFQKCWRLKKWRRFQQEVFRLAKRFLRGGQRSHPPRSVTNGVVEVVDMNPPIALQDETIVAFPKTK